MSDTHKKDYMRAYRRDYRERITRIAATLDNEQAERFNALAKSEGMKPATFLRHLVESALEKKPFVSSAVVEELKAVSFLIRTIANNVNQTAHHSHVMKQLVNENDLLGELRKLEQAVNYPALKDGVCGCTRTILRRHHAPR
jgi:predicted DNA-binding protein